MRTAFAVGPIALLVSFYYAGLAFGWWAIVVIPVSMLVWFTHGGRASMGRPRLWWMTIVLAVFVWLTASEPSRIYPWCVAIIGAMYLDRIKYRTAVFFLRALVIRNEKAYELLADTLLLKEV